MSRTVRDMSHGAITVAIFVVIVLRCNNLGTATALDDHEVERRARIHGARTGLTPSALELLPEPPLALGLVFLVCRPHRAVLERIDDDPPTGRHLHDPAPVVGLGARVGIGGGQHLQGIRALLPRDERAPREPDERSVIEAVLVAL